MGRRKTKTYNNFNLLISDYILPKISTPRAKKFTPKLFVFRTNLKRGPFIKIATSKKNYKIHWMEWFFQNIGSALEILKAEFTKNGLDWEEFFIEIETEKSYISFEKTEPQPTQVRDWVTQNHTTGVELLYPVFTEKET